MKKGSIAVLCISSLLGAACAAPTDDVHEDEEIATQSAALVNVLGSGYAWVQSSGAFGGGWNSTRGAITSSKLTTGQYKVTFAGQPATNANAQVVAYGSSFAHCKLLTNALGSTSTTWYVLCYNAAGSFTDSAFNIVTDHRTGSNFPGSAYLTSSSSGVVSQSWNSGGSTNTVSVVSTGVYTVTTPGTASNSSVHVTAIGVDAVRCKIGSWGTTGATVRCFDSSGAPANGRFSFSRRRASLIEGQIGAHAWVDRGTLPSTYTLATGNCPQNLTEPLTIATSGGDLLLTLPDATLPPGNGWSDVIPVVTAYGSTANTCQIVGWNMSGTTATARVRCFNNAGTQVNASTTQFDFTFTSKYFPFC